MTENEQEIESIEAQIVDLKIRVEHKDLALELENNRAFRKLILDGFCETECARFARNSGDPALSKEEREMSLAMAQAAGHLRRWLSMTVKLGFQSENTIRDGEEQLQELRAEGQGQ